MTKISGEGDCNEPTKGLKSGWDEILAFHRSVGVKWRKISKVIIERKETKESVH